MPKSLYFLEVAVWAAGANQTTLSHPTNFSVAERTFCNNYEEAQAFANTFCSEQRLKPTPENHFFNGAINMYELRHVTDENRQPTATLLATFKSKTGQWKLNT